MKKASVVGLGVLLVGLVVAYLWPVPRRDFAELAARVDPAVRQSLLAFRRQHAPKHLRVGAHEWEYVAFGEGQKTVLFLHGMTGAYDIWWQQMVALAPRAKVVSLTYPPVPTLAGLSEGVVAILDAEGVARANVVGTSLGGYLTQYLMARHPGRVEKAVLGNTFPPNDILRRRNEALIRVLPFLPDWVVMEVFRRSTVKNIYPASGHSELVLAYMLEQVSGRMSKAQVTARARAVIEPFSPPDVASLGTPVLIVEADNDPLVDETLRAQLKATYPTAEVRTLRSVGHFPYLNAADTYTELLRRFFGL